MEEIWNTPDFLADTVESLALKNTMGVGAIMNGTGVGVLITDEVKDGSFIIALE